CWEALLSERNCGQQSWRLCKAQLKPWDCVSIHLQNMRRTFLELEKEE
ncbi:hypothetical protein E2320_000209, partial [Naja naja]